MSSSAARAASLSILQAPSSSEYSLWTCRWTAPALTRRSCLRRRTESIRKAHRKSADPAPAAEIRRIVTLCTYGGAEVDKRRPIDSVGGGDLDPQARGGGGRRGQAR